MNSYLYPDFSEQGYQILRDLGCNREGGRITWLASKIDTGEKVVLKQFCFAQAGSSWSGFNAYEKEIQILQELDHPGIPHYLSSFDRPDGFCLVQEYINAPSLAENRSFSPEEIRQIAIKALEILVYLQNRIPSVIHRDLKPENILVDEQMNVYLVDFGMSRLGSQEVAGSSVFKGTPGFIPPEQMFEPTKATDLYALGVTLICLLIEIKSTEVRELCDRNNPYQIQFQDHLPNLSLGLIGWLEKMVQPSQDKRFPNAKAALVALQPIDIIRQPAVELSASVLEFKATRLREKLKQTIIVENPIANTVLQGRWEVVPHPQDPPHTPDAHAWIFVKQTVNCTEKPVNCGVCVDTSKLMADKTYKRQLILHSNAYPTTRTITIKVQTAPIPVERRKIPYLGLTKLCFMAVVVAMGAVWFKVYAAPEVASWLLATTRYGTVMFCFYLWAFIVALCAITTYPKLGNIEARSTMVSDVARFVYLHVFWAGGVALGAAPVVLIILLSRGVPVIDYVMGNVHVAVDLVVGLVVGFFVMMVVDMVVNTVILWAVNLAEDLFTSTLLLLIVGFGASTGIALIVGFLNPFILLSILGTGLPVLSMLFYPQIKRRRLIVKYRHAEDLLIKP